MWWRNTPEKRTETSYGGNGWQQSRNNWNGVRKRPSFVCFNSYLNTENSFKTELFWYLYFQLEYKDFGMTIHEQEATLSTAT